MKKITKNFVFLGFMTGWIKETQQKFKKLSELPEISNTSTCSYCDDSDYAFLLLANMSLTTVLDAAK